MQRKLTGIVMLGSVLLPLASAHAGAQEYVEGEWSDWNTSPDACLSPVEHIDANGESVRSRGYAIFSSGAVEGYDAEFYDRGGDPLDDDEVPEGEEIRGQAVCFQQPNNHGESILEESDWGKSVRFEFCPDDYPYVGVIPNQTDQLKVWIRCQIRARN